MFEPEVYEFFSMPRAEFLKRYSVFVNACLCGGPLDEFTFNVPENTTRVAIIHGESPRYYLRPTSTLNGLECVLYYKSERKQDMYYYTERKEDVDAKEVCTINLGAFKLNDKPIMHDKIS